MKLGAYRQAHLAHGRRYATRVSYILEKQVLQSESQEGQEKAKQMPYVKILKGISLTWEEAQQLSANRGDWRRQPLKL